MARKVLLPKEIDARLDGLSGLIEEVDGILLYRRQGDYCPVEALFMTGVGSAGHVQAQPARIQVANEFFRQNPSYQFVKFHTHSKGTIDKFGQYYSRHFSRGDIDAIKEQLKHDRDFMAMLVTPEIKLLCGIDNPELSVVNGFSDYQDRSRVVSQSLEIIARNLGYDFSLMQATR
ncbi:MAG: hypothetical protein V1659_03850 [Candidatus Woesearchaeota archaeon]